MKYLRLLRFLSILRHRGVRRQPARAAKLLQLRDQLGDALGLLGREVLRFAGVGGEVVELADGVVARIGVRVGVALRALAGADVFPIARAQGEHAGTGDVRRAAGRRVTEQCGENVLTVARLGKFRTGERGEGGMEIELRHERVGAAGFHAARPAHEEGHAGARLEVAVFTAAPQTGGLVRAELRHRVVLVAVVNHWAVVAAEDDHRFLREFEAVERGEQFAHAPVHLHDGVAARAHAGLAHEARMRHARHMDVLRAEVEEEGFVLVCLDEADGFADENVRHVLVLPVRRRAALHVADAADAVDEGHVVAVAGVHLEQLGVRLAGGQAGERFLVTHFNRVLRVEASDTAVANVNTGHAVAGGGHDEAEVETGFVRAGFDCAVPVRPALRPEAEVPLAHRASRVARAAQRERQRASLGFDDQARIAGQHAGAAFAPRVFPSEHGVARWRAGGGSAVAVGEAQPFAREPVHVGRLHGLRAIAAGVAVTEIINIDEQDVGLGGRREKLAVKGRRDRKADCEDGNWQTHGGTLADTERRCPTCFAYSRRCASWTPVLPSLLRLAHRAGCRIVAA